MRVRKVPTIAKPEMKTLSVLGLLHAISHITAITSLGAGAVRYGGVMGAGWGASDDQSVIPSISILVLFPYPPPDPSFTHIVKSAEPFFSAVFAGLFLRQFFHPLVYASLVSPCA